jgi:hypothetical protein
MSSALNPQRLPGVARWSGSLSVELERYLELVVSFTTDPVLTPGALIAVDHVVAVLDETSLSLDNLLYRLRLDLTRAPLGSDIRPGLLRAMRCLEAVIHAHADSHPTLNG